jgi:multidrug transporter EmrE-like cation transporter
MERVVQLAVITAAAFSVALADVLIKQVGVVSGRLSEALRHPLMAVALVLYAVQIVLFAYVFVRRWELGVVALLQMAFYAAACVLVGRFLFGERVTAVQGLGMVLTFAGAVLMNSGQW